jgi:acyl-CoA synthetase (NDP forming)
VSAAAPEASVDGVVVQELVDVGVECVVGVTPHPRFGPVVTFGLGGVLVAGPDGATAVDLLCELDAEAPLGGRERTVEERGR